MPRPLPAMEVGGHWTLGQQARDGTWSPACSEAPGTQARVAHYQSVGRAPTGSPPQAEPRETKMAGTTGHGTRILVCRLVHLRLQARGQTCMQTHAHAHVQATQLETAGCLGGQRAPPSHVSKPCGGGELGGAIFLFPGPAVSSPWQGAFLRGSSQDLLWGERPL